MDLTCVLIYMSSLFSVGFSAINFADSNFATNFLDDSMDTQIALSKPNVTKRGDCPEEHLMAFTGSNNCIGNCDFAANRDSDCSGSLKCCSNGCAEFCVRPFTGYGFLVNGRWPININGNYIRESKPGSCPATYTGWSIRNCQPICWADRDCSGSQKCCADTGCPYCADVGPVLPIKTTQITTRALLLRKSDRKLGLHRATDPERRVVPLEHTNLARFMPRKVIVSPGPVYVAPRVRAAEPIRLVATQQQPAPSPRIVQPVYQRAVQTFERAAPAPVVPQPSWRSRG